MKKFISILFVLLPLLFSCTGKDNEIILPTTGNAILIDNLGNFNGADYYVVTEQYFLSKDDPYSSPDDLIKGKISTTRTSIDDLNAGVYYIIFHKSNFMNVSRILQIKAGETIEKKLDWRIKYNWEKYLFPVWV